MTKSAEPWPAGKWVINDPADAPIRGLQAARVQFIPAVRPAGAGIKPPPVSKPTKAR